MVKLRKTDKEILQVLESYKGVAKHASDIMRDMWKFGYKRGYAGVRQNLEILAHEGDIKYYCSCYGIPAKSKCGIVFMLFKLDKVLVMDEAWERFSAPSLPQFKWDDEEETYYDAMLRRRNELIDTLGDILKEHTLDWIKHRIICPRCGHRFVLEDEETEEKRSRSEDVVSS